MHPHISFARYRIALRRYGLPYLKGLRQEKSGRLLAANIKRNKTRIDGPPFMPATFTRHELQVGGRAEYFLTGPNGETWSGSWKFTAVRPIDSFEADGGDDNVDDENMPASMKFAFETTPAGSRMTVVTQFPSVAAMEQVASGMEEGLRAAMPQLDTGLAEPDASAAALGRHSSPEPRMSPRACSKRRRRRCSPATTSMWVAFRSSGRLACAHT